MTRGCKEDGFTNGKVERLYLTAISRACDGVITILVSGVADFSSEFNLRLIPTLDPKEESPAETFCALDYRRLLMTASIMFFGVLALPFAGLTSQSYPNLVAVSVLWTAMNTINGVYGTMEGSYIPHFMRAAGLTAAHARATNGGDTSTTAAPRASPPTEAETTRISYNRGSRVSTFGLVASNLGSITASLIGIVISYTRGNVVVAGYANFMIAITVAGCMTVALGAIGGTLVPSIRGAPPPAGNLLLIALGRWVKLLRSLPRYPETFKFVVGWILWYTAYSNFNTVVSLLFREIYGIGLGDSLFTVWSCTAIVFATCGSLTWGFVFPHTRLGLKTWAYAFLSLNALCVFWGCIGISNSVNVGYKNGPEFWVEQVIFLSTSSALRATNRVIYASTIPEGHEAQFFGLELTLDLATGWIGPLLTGSIQNAAGNLRVPMVIHLVLIGIAAGLYWWTDLEKGRQDAKKPMQKN